MRKYPRPVLPPSPMEPARSERTFLYQIVFRPFLCDMAVCRHLQSDITFAELPFHCHVAMDFTNPGVFIVQAVLTEKQLLAYFPILDNLVKHYEND